MIHKVYPIPDKLINIPPINTSILDIPTEVITENLYGSISHGNSWTPPLNTDTSQFSDNSTIPSILTNCNTPQLPKYSSSNQVTKKIEAKRIGMKNSIKCGTSIIDQKVKYLYERFNGIKETEKSNEMLLKNSTFLQNKLIRRDEIIKPLLETQTFTLEKILQTSVEEKKEKREHHQQEIK